MPAARSQTLLLTLLIVLHAALARADTALELTEVLRGLEDHHPVILAERASVAAAEGELRAARGEFDPTLSVQGRTTPSGYYDPTRLDVLLDQPTPVLGASLYAGYRRTSGQVAPYYGEQRTLDGGEVKSGVRLPLLQDRSIDARRAGRENARTQLAASREGYKKLMLDLERDATWAYYAWVAAGQRVSVVDKLVTLAELRDSQIAQKVELGALPAIERLDNRRSILERKRQLVGARRALEKAALDLSLFVRSQDGSPRVPFASELPAALALPSTPMPTEVEAAKRALETRPELAQQAALVRSARIDEELAENRVAPRLDAFGEVSKDFGDGDDAAIEPTLRPTVVEVGVTFSIPLGLRKARGKRDAAEAKLEASEHKAAFVRDRVRTEALDAWSQLSAAHERLSVAREAAEAAAAVADGERERFELGAATVLFVNLREQAAADAQIAVVDAAAEVAQASARLKLAMGEHLFP